MIYHGASLMSPAQRSVAMARNASYETSTARSAYARTAPRSASIARASKVISDREDSIQSDAAMLTVAVPAENAEVTVNGHPTTSDGTTRQFLSRGLKDGYVYTYNVEVSYEVDGQRKSDRKTVKLRRGDVERMEFAEQPSPTQSAEVKNPVTVVKLHVPSDASVTLAGNRTTGQGELRTFRTRQLAAGEKWTGYTVRVTHEVAGRLVTKERNVDVAAGSTTELTIDFDESEIARR
jgi:uncharacterized protein (TIGR03000 family)